MFMCVVVLNQVRELQVYRGSWHIKYTSEGSAAVPRYSVIGLLPKAIDDGAVALVR